MPVNYQHAKARSAEIAREIAAAKARLEERKAAAARARADHERHWLAQERPPLGGARRRSKPLSRMPA
jgi:hypothetical protein